MSQYGSSRGSDGFGNGFDSFGSDSFGELEGNGFGYEGPVGDPFGPDFGSTNYRQKKTKKKPAIVKILFVVLGVLALIGAIREIISGKNSSGSQAQTVPTQQEGQTSPGNSQIPKPSMDGTGPIASRKNPTKALRDDRKADLSNVDFNRTCEWTHQYTAYDKMTTYTLHYDEFPLGAYEYYSSLDRYPLDDWTKYLTDEYNCLMCDDLANYFAGTSLSEFGAVSNAVAFVQSLEYLPDGGTGEVEYPKYPIETIYEKGGDCEDTSLLLCGIIRSMGYDSVLVIFDTHVGVGILGEGLEGTYYDVDGRKYYYTETTGENWKIGEMPEEHRGMSARILEVK